MAHHLFLGMYAFKIKKANTSNNDTLENNDFLSKAYPDCKEKFSEGFVQDIINLIDQKTYKNKENTHGAVLESQECHNSKRILDLLINGGITGISQFIIDESGRKTTLTRDQIVGLKFYARIWLPANTHTGYLFIQRYGTLSIKPVFDSIIHDVLNAKGFNMAGLRMVATTTQNRLESFLEHSTIKDVLIISKKSIHNTGSADASSAVIRLKNFTKPDNSKALVKADIPQALSNHGLTMTGSDYTVKATYLYQSKNYKEEKTVELDTSEQTINLIPNILVPESCIDSDNYPIFKEMQKFADAEMAQINRESKH